MCFYACLPMLCTVCVSKIYQFIYDFGNVGFCNFGLLIDLVCCGFQGLRKKVGFSEGF
jgi:hypothetical protein